MKQLCSDLELYLMDVTDSNPCPECTGQSEDPRCTHYITCEGLNELAKKAFEISLLRHQDPQDVFKHMAGEVIEANEASMMHLADPSNANHTRQLLADELADVIICALSASCRFKLNIEAAIARKMKRNQERIGEDK